MSASLIEDVPQADAEGRATWLCSSNLANTEFYEQCGFVGVRDFTLGEDDPTWTKPPVVARVVSGRRLVPIIFCVFRDDVFGRFVLDGQRARERAHGSEKME